MVGKTPREKGQQASVQKRSEEQGGGGVQEERGEERKQTDSTTGVGVRMQQGTAEGTEKEKSGDGRRRNGSRRGERKRARDKMWKAWSSSGKTGENEAKENKGTGCGAKDGAEPPD